MKYIILALSFLLSNCALVPVYSIPEDHAKWIHSQTGEEVSHTIEHVCEKKAQLMILGRESYMDKIDSEYYKKWGEILKVKGACLYSYGFVFKVKPLSPYCYKLEKVCDAYERYRR